MEYKSNITVASNVFIRKHSDVKEDPDFVHSCRGGRALSELHARWLFGANTQVKLTQAQDHERQQDKGCSLADDKQMTHGPVRHGNDIVWECRCECDSCIRLDKCMPNPIVREINNLASNKIMESVDLKYEWLGTVLPIERIFDDFDFDVEEEPIPSKFVVTPVALAGEYIELTEPSTIISADIHSNILVNAGPGTGKTHTVIERLAHIIRSGDIELGQVLVLCYTNAARDVILNRLTDKGMGAEARQLVVCTLDSLAWQNLSSKFEATNASELFALGFNGCIKKFNLEFHSEEWSQFEYVIIDELQDLVNERAKMALKILAAINCGYLLLGDKCQAIYDFDCNDDESMNSVEFYTQLNALMPKDKSLYELKGNRRQSIELSSCSDDLRTALLEFNTAEANDFFHTHIDEMLGIPFSPNSFASLPHTDTTAILTRNNGESEWISAQLHKKNIPHTLFRSVTPQISLNRWLADMFWDYREPRMNKDNFIERYLIRVEDDAELAENAYNALVATLQDAQGIFDYFELEKLTKALTTGQDISPLLLNMPCDLLTVSTIHKAKGREFDHVYLLGNFNLSTDSTEEARVWYVGATRPKSSLDVMNKGKWCIRKSSTTRWIFQGFQPWKKIAFCNRVVVGLREDINRNGFIDGDLEQAVGRQSYIGKQVQINDTVDIYLTDGIYQVYHKGFCIGELSEDARMGLLTSIKSLYRWSDIPPHLSDIYVKNIITIVPHAFPSGADKMFKDSKFWLGVELTGFAKADWHGGVK